MTPRGPRPATPTAATLTVLRGRPTDEELAALLAVLAAVAHRARPSAAPTARARRRLALPPRWHGPAAWAPAVGGTTRR